MIHCAPRDVSVATGYPATARETDNLTCLFTVMELRVNSQKLIKPSDAVSFQHLADYSTFSFWLTGDRNAITKGSKKSFFAQDLTRAAGHTNGALLV